MNLNNATILVTGGASGIGLETARLLISQGAKVAICGRNSERLERAAAGVGALPICADVSLEADVKRMVQTVIAEFGDYNALVNNAGYGYFAPLIEQDLHQFNRLFLTNVAGAMLVARESARYFISRQRGNIINISSTAGSKGFAGGTAYAASKFALTGMTECWRAELHSGGTKSRGFRIDVRHCQQNPIPPTRNGLRAVRQWPTTGTLYFARPNLRALFGAQSFDPRGVSLGGVE